MVTSQLLYFAGNMERDGGTSGSTAPTIRTRIATIAAKIVFGIVCICVLGIYAASIAAFIVSGVGTGYIILLVALIMTALVGILYKSHLGPLWRRERNSRLVIVPQG